MTRTASALFLLLATLGIFASAQTPPDKAALIEEFMTATDLEQTQRQLFDQIRQSINQQTEQLFGPQMESNAAARAEVRAFQDQVMALVTEKLSWANTKPIYAALYDEVFSADELRSLVEFFHSPAGKSYVSKMPALFQKSNEKTQQQFSALSPELQRMVTAFAARMQVKYPPK
jgi:uncharacterized protein